MPSHAPEPVGHITASVQSGKTRNLALHEPFVSLVPIPIAFKAKGLEGPTLPLPRLSREQGAVLSAYTGVLCGDFEDLHAYVEQLYGRPVARRELSERGPEIKQLASKDFLRLAAD